MATAPPARGPSADVPPTMRCAMRNHGGDPLLIHEMEPPRPNPGFVLVKLDMTGVCHTDIHACRNDWPIKTVDPLVPGHEGVGRVAALGEGVDCLEVGCRVGVPFLQHSCHECSACAGGWEMLCDKPLFSGWTSNGTYAEYITADARNVVPIPDAVDDDQAAPIMCAGVTVYKALTVCDAKPGQRVAVWGGGGGLGHLAVQYGKAMGYSIVAVDKGNEQLDLARSVGADETRAASEPFGPPCDAAIVVAPSADAFSKALDSLKPRGTCVVVGQPPGDYCFSPVKLTLKCHTIRGSLVGTAQDAQAALQFVADRRVKVHTHVLPSGLLSAGARVGGEAQGFTWALQALEAGKMAGRVVLDLASAEPPGRPA